MNNQIYTKGSSWPLKSLAIAIASSMLSTAAQASIERHGDLEIYKGAQEALPVITLMLDVSGSMDIIDEPSTGGCNYDGREPYEENTYGYM